MNGFLIGRFQPFHLGHVEAIKFALSNVEQKLNNEAMYHYLTFSSTPAPLTMFKKIKKSTISKFGAFILPLLLQEYGMYCKNLSGDDDAPHHLDL